MDIKRDTVGMDDLIATIDRNLRRIDRTILYCASFLAGVMIANRIGTRN